jgi:hypothetical protein
MGLNGWAALGDAPLPFCWRVQAVCQPPQQGCTPLYAPFQAASGKPASLLRATIRNRL